MRCPRCGSDTDPALPTCSRCDAPLTDNATTPDPGPFGEPRYGSSDRPPPTPWSPSPQEPAAWSPPPQDPAPWSPPPRDPWAGDEGGPNDSWTRPAPPGEHGPGEHGHGEPPGGETSISLSREPWDEPEIWQPPPPRRKRSALPVILLAAGVVLLAGIASAIVLWPSGSDVQPGTPTTQQSQGVPSESGGTESPAATTSGAGVTEQAGKVDALLTEMVATRSELGSVTGDGECERSGLERIRSQRQDQLDQARDLDVTALDGGAEMKAALVRALSASVESNGNYLTMAPDCPTDATDADRRASTAKSEFIGHWTPIAEQAGLQPRSADTI
ncbi:hypothetical protein [Spirillospora sp. NPDC047279]|uniref:hypothetical protein n=1 Tax=Spirillospora sp. NPDC047279 TaxID=3155478 RepID=UPI0033D836C1